MMNNIAKLQRAGFDVTGISDRERSVLEGLTEGEIATMVSVKARIDEVGPDVEGHSVASTGGASGGWCW